VTSDDGARTKKHVRADVARADERVVRLTMSVTRGPDAGKTFAAEPRARATVGTGEGTDLRLTDPTVSRYHVELEPTSSGVLVRDLGSLNGTYLGRAKLVSAEVAPGTTLTLGDTSLAVSSADLLAPGDVPDVPEIVTRSPRMHDVLRHIARLARLALPVLVTGETGTGKELVAKALHDKGPRARGPFVVVDCGALSPLLVESELFGHERGAFTGAVARHVGALERAQGGTVFLDEIGELPAPAQAALLGALERKRVRRVGGSGEVALDVRVVSATHRDLRAEVNRGSFRADLYYRIAGAHLSLPPLRERPEDIPLLVRRFAEEAGGSPDLVPESVVEAFSRMHFAGNVRELRNAVERALALDLAEPEPHVSSPREGEPHVHEAGPVVRYRDARAKAVADFERAYVTDLIARAGGNASEAARLAKMDRPYLLGLLRRYSLR
jgi:DNA-binding NtrC family response regulator